MVIVGCIARFMWIVGSGRHEEAMNRMWTGETRRQAGSRSERTVIPADRPPKCVIKLQPLTNTLRCLKLDQEMSKSEDKRHSSYQKKKRFATGKEPAAKFSKKKDGVVPVEPVVNVPT